jgi:streptogramin lyase
MADLAPGDEFAGHRIESIAGRGGMGVVYRATELSLDRTVALKLITPALAGDPEFRARFVRESRAAASIEHPNVIPIFHAGSEQDVLYISMRFVDGEDLRALLRREGRLDPPRATRIVAQVAAALDAAHERGLVHRDVKPANVLLTSNEHVYLTDFGLIKRIGEGATQISRPGWVGTLGYVAPEQIRGERVDARSDVYALGSVLFHTLTGGPPFAADTDEATLWRHLHDEPPSVNGQAPVAFDPVIRRALAKNPDHRYPSAGDLGRAALAAAGESVSERPERQVARGSAAPGDVDEDETVISGGATLPTAAAPTAAAPAPAARRDRRPFIAAGVLLAAIAVVAVIVLATGGGGGGKSPSTTGTTTAPTSTSAGAITLTVPVVPRPNAIAIAGGSVWVGGFTDSAIVLVDPKTGKTTGRITVPTGTTEMAARGGSVWVVNQLRRTVARISVRTHKVIGRPISVPGSPVAVAVTRTAVWVGSRTGARSGQRTQLLIKLDPRTGALVNTIPIPRGVQNLAVGEGAVWITNRFAPTVTRVDIQTGQQSIIRVGASPKGVDVGGGFVWVANEGDGTVTRIDPNTEAPAPIQTSVHPRGIAANAKAVWVSGYADSEVERLDPRTARRVGEPVGTKIGPFKLALSGQTLWITAVTGNSLQRLDFQ